MKTKFLLIPVIIFFMFSAQIFSQAITFKTSWYHVLSGAKIKVVKPNSADISSKKNLSVINYGDNEVLLAFYFEDDKYYCFDPDARIVIVKGAASLKKIETAGRAVKISTSVIVNSSVTLGVGNNVWLVGYNSDETKAKILLNDGITYEIPATSITEFIDTYNETDKITDYNTVD
jgi:hypothetical protein